MDSFAMESSSFLEKMICRILLLIILTSCVSGSFVVNVTQTSYQAEENHNITLEWTFTTKPDRSSKTLNILCEHFISDKLSVLFHVHEGVEVSESQDAKFSGRVQSDKDALREGRIRLQLSRLRTDDSGLYLCEVNTDYGFSSARCRVSVSGAESRNKNYWDQVKIVLGVLESALLIVSGMIVLIIVAVQGLVQSFRKHKIGGPLLK
ncbi:uncharacterized protein LOC100708740 isoform X2 [Oreochromis niloticus]|uniref:uncharacterized protein LOC100708740 isoform X2 n=1 Tax=Oreochromis niloticus TaxID=8128 RepID=UPI000DF12B8C|nr:uncharacterized protein LOC100708740 isoform X2 [Oreochromis niloticus]